MRHEVLSRTRGSLVATNGGAQLLLTHTGGAGGAPPGTGRGDVWCLFFLCRGSPLVIVVWPPCLRCHLAARLASSSLDEARSCL